MSSNKEVDQFFSLLDSEDLSTSVDEEVDVTALSEKIRAVTSSILEEVFKNDPEKQEIISRDNRYNFACPSCGDSKWNSKKKRGNIYYNGFNFKCYNAEDSWCASIRSIVSFLSKFGKIKEFSNVEIAFLKSNTAKHQEISLSNTGGGSKNFSAYASDIFGIEKYAIPRNEIMKVKNVQAKWGIQKVRFQNVEDNLSAIKYLRKRKQLDIVDTRHFAYDRLNHNLLIFNLTPDKESVIGIQQRMLGRKKKNGKKPLRFMSYTYSDIWKKMLGVESVKEEIAGMVDRYSLLYNVLNVNYGKDVNIFEAAIDSHHMKNSIALLSASTKIYLDSGKYFFDNSTIDKAGQIAALDMMKRGYSVFLWEKFLKDYPRYRKCKDLNDIVREKPIEESKLKEYFSNDSLDMIYL